MLEEGDNHLRIQDPVDPKAQPAGSLSTEEGSPITQWEWQAAASATSRDLF